MSTTQTATTIHIPTPLRSYTDGAASVDVTGSTVGDALKNLVEQHPSLKPHLYTDEGKLRSFVNIYVGDEDIRYLDGEATALDGRTDVSIVPSIAGGR
jgi:molybdopterin converting factor small subunit